MRKGFALFLSDALTGLIGNNHGRCRVFRYGPELREDERDEDPDTDGRRDADDELE